MLLQTYKRPVMDWITIGKDGIDEDAVDAATFYLDDDSDGLEIRIKPSWDVKVVEIM